MPALKAQFAVPATHVEGRQSTLRMATSDDVGAGSEVAFLQSMIEAEFGVAGPRPWPRAISVPVVIAVASGLWWGLIVLGQAIAKV